MIRPIKKTYKISPLKRPLIKTLIRPIKKAFKKTLKRPIKGIILIKKILNTLYMKLILNLIKILINMFKV